METLFEFLVARLFALFQLQPLWERLLYCFNYVKSNDTIKLYNFV